MTQFSLLKSFGLQLRNGYGYGYSQVHRPIHDTTWPLAR